MAWTREQVDAAIKAGILKPHPDNLTPEQREAWTAIPWRLEPTTAELLANLRTAGMARDNLGAAPLTFHAYQPPEPSEAAHAFLACAHEWGEFQGADIMDGDVAVGRAQVSRCARCGNHLVVSENL